MFSKILEVSLVTEEYDIHLHLNHNINILTGESGEGKSHLVSALNESRDSIVVSINSRPIDVEVLIFTDTFYPKELEGNSSKVIIIDDIRDIYKTNAITESLKKNNSLYFLIVARDMSTVPANTLFSCFYDSVYYVETSALKGIEYFSLVRAVDKLTTNEDVSRKYDTCIIEGSYGKAEYMFMSNFFKDIRCCDGKSNVVANLYEYNGIVGVISVDLCAIGIFILDILDALSKSDCILVDSPSFEYDLVYAMADENKRNEYDGISSDVIDGMFFENYFYHELIKLRFGLCGKCSKSGIVKCLYNECDEVCSVPKEQRSKCKLYCENLQERLKYLCSKSKALSEIYEASKEV